MKEEKWLPVKEYEGEYEISNFGRVKSLTRVVSNGRGGVLHVEGRILNFSPNSNGYLYARFRTERKKKYIHHLVAEHFIGERPAGAHIDHIDGNRTNNDVANLRYCTPKENISKPGSKNGFAKLTESEVLQIRAKYVWRKYGVGILSKEFNIHPTHVHDIVTRKRWTHI